MICFCLPDHEESIGKQDSPVSLQDVPRITVWRNKAPSRHLLLTWLTLVNMFCPCCLLIFETNMSRWVLKVAFEHLGRVNTNGFQAGKRCASMRSWHAARSHGKHQIDGAANCFKLLYVSRDRACSFGFALRHLKQLTCEIL